MALSDETVDSLVADKIDYLYCCLMRVVISVMVLHLVNAFVRSIVADDPSLTLIENLLCNPVVSKRKKIHYTIHFSI